ncbi:hypothetical protein OEA41_004366 [Lepraria neglecta]|uniref:Uncharacterized protein n=1 Tax=Lepraria neglecta TaxID=209136 RepID=A0AAE0DG33_9LECA|nr:hypothetical protein OEA41_004366 [Lepraria neglecta]
MQQTPISTRYNTYDTPQNSKVQGAHEYLVAKGEIFDFFRVQERSGYKFIEDGAPSRTRKNQEGVNETRGRKSKLSGADIRETDHLLEETGLPQIEARGMYWGAITWTLDLDGSGPTLQPTIRDAITYSKYVSALKEFLPEPLEEKRREWAKIMYAKYRNPEDWDRVRFSDEVHAGYSPKGTYG